MINNCAKLLMCHAHDLLDNKVLEGGEIVPIMRTANLKHLLEDTILMHRMQAENVSKIRVHNAVMNGVRDLKIKFDAQRLQQVLNNLLSNAIKFSPAFTTITVSGAV